MRDIFKPAFSLLLICAVVTFFVSLTYNVTKDTIRHRELDELNAAMSDVLPEGKNFNEITNDFEDTYGDVKVDAVYESEAGMVFSLKTPGYGGDVAVIIGIGNDGVISGVRLGSNNETPSLGKQAEEPFFTSRFNKITVKESIADSVDSISGVTITSTAVKKAVQSACNQYNQLKGGTGN
ncbi:MAG: FMN-binding protein [Clostridiales bacterium]|nr:FMN-binding protein [Clostridiales bacterium]